MNILLMNKTKRVRMTFSAAIPLPRQGTSFNRVGIMNGKGTKNCMAYVVQMDSTIISLVHWAILMRLISD